MTFTIAALATSIAGLILGLGWLFGGRLVLSRWGLEANPLGLLVGRRLGAAYLGIALMLFLGVEVILAGCFAAALIER